MQGWLRKPTSHSGSFQSTLHPASDKYAHPPQGQSSGFLQTPVRPTGPQAAKVAHVSVLGPWLWHPGCGLAHSLPKEDLCPYNSPSPLPATRTPTSSFIFPSYSMACISFSQLWLCRSPLASLQLVFSENCSTCRFLMCLGGKVSFASSTPSCLWDIALWPYYLAKFTTMLVSSEG